MNVVYLIGNLGRDPETRYTKTGKPVMNLSLATSDGPKDAKVTTWHSVVAWDWMVEKLRDAKKGSRVFVTGRIQVREYTDKAGVKKYVNEVVAQNVETIDKPHSAPLNPPTPEAFPDHAAPVVKLPDPHPPMDAVFDDLPF